MKSLRNTLLLTAAAVMLVFAACKKPVPTQTKYIPKDVSFVFAANVKNLQEKLEKSKISIDSLFKKAIAESKSSASELAKWDDFKNAGVKWQSEIYVYMQSKGAMITGSNAIFGAVAAMDDKSKFQAYLKKQAPDAEIKEGSGYSYANIKGGFSIGWNSDVIVVAGAVGEKYSNNGTVNNAEAQITAAFSQKEAESVAGIPEFRELAGKKSDALVWSNSTASLAAIPMIGLTKAADLFKDCYSAATLNFEDGKITGESATYMGKALSDIVKKYDMPEVDIKALEKFPSNNIDGFISMSFQPGILVDIVKYMGVEAIANQYLASMGFSLEDIIKAFKGEFTFIASDFAIEEKPNAFLPQYKTKQPVFKMIVNAKMGDKAAYTKVTNALAAKGILVQQGNQYVPAMATGGYPVTLDEKDLYFASDSVVLQQYKAGAGKAAISDEIKNKIKGKASAVYFDFSKIIAGIPADSSYAALKAEAQATFKDFIAVSERKFDGKKIGSSFELRTGNDKENSLASIIKFVQKAVAAAETERKSRNAILDEEVTLDSLPAGDVVAPPLLEQPNK
ncbi:DUF4836 family protein [Filimonas effusa]|nr:DUF4836 family protein [Filimonas effusa]